MQLTADRRLALKRMYTYMIWLLVEMMSHSSRVSGVEVWLVDGIE